jgi:hypothetical protein
LRSYVEEIVAAPVQKTENTAVGRSVGIIRLRTKAPEFVFFVRVVGLLQG